MTVEAPAEVIHVDIGRPLPSVGAGPGALLVFWLHEVPLGQCFIDASDRPLGPPHVADIAAEAVATAVTHRLGHAGRPCWPAPLDDTVGTAALDADDPLASIADELSVDDGAGPTAADVAVVVATRDRPADLDRCLMSVARLDPPPEEVLVVDNSRRGTARAVVEGHRRIGYLPVPVGGLSVARNAGIDNTTRSVIAFTDDDVEVHPRWLRRLIRPFADPHVMATTGLVLPAAIETEAQLVFERRLGYLNKHYRPKRYDSSFLAAHTRWAAPVWEIGAGANMAVRRRVVDEVGPFDTRLGAGAAGCSEDSELWFRVLTAGWACIYEPAAVVFHHHRRDLHGLLDMERAYMRGHTAALGVELADARRAGELRRLATGIPGMLARQAPRELVASPLRRRLFGARASGYLSGLKLAVRLVVSGTPPRGVQR